MRHVCAVASLVLVSGSVLAQDTPAASAAPDCLGRDSLPLVDIGRVGALRLGRSVGELRRLCRNTRDTIATGAETLDTAIVISRPGLSVVGRLALISGGDVDVKYVANPSHLIYRWTVTGSDGLLPGGVRLSATWDSLVLAYGLPPRSHVITLNGDVIVRFCERLPLMVFHFRHSEYFTNPPYQGPDSYPKYLSGERITSVDFTSRPPLPGEFSPCGYLQRRP